MATWAPLCRACRVSKRARWGGHALSVEAWAFSSNAHRLTWMIAWWCGWGGGEGLVSDHVLGVSRISCLFSFSLFVSLLA